MTKHNGFTPPATILAIWGYEPPRKDEYPMAYVVGSPCGTRGQESAPTSRIAYREVDYGDHRLGFFDVFIMVGGEERQVVSVGARAVAEVHYAQDEGPTQ